MLIIFEYLLAEAQPAVVTQSSPWTPLLQIALGGLCGFVGYIATNFCFKPILLYHEIRHRVTSDMVFYANIMASESCSVLPPADITEVALQKPMGMEDCLRDQRINLNRKNAAELRAVYYRLPLWYRKWLKLFGEEPLEASISLIGLSKCNQAEEFSSFLTRLKKSLRINPRDGHQMLPPKGIIRVKQIKWVAAIRKKFSNKNDN